MERRPRHRTATSPSRDTGSRPPVHGFRRGCIIGPFPIRVALGHVGPPLLLFLLLFVGHPFRDVFSFNPDESNNLMKAQLVAAGHSLFSDIWSDQPAVFTYMLRHWMDFTAWTVEQARILVLLCSCVLIWSFYQVVRRTASHVGAALACLLLVTSHSTST